MRWTYKKIKHRILRAKHFSRACILAWLASSRSVCALCLWDTQNFLMISPGKECFQHPCITNVYFPECPENSFKFKIKMFLWLPYIFHYFIRYLQNFPYPEYAFDYRTSREGGTKGSIRTDAAITTTSKFKYLLWKRRKINRSERNMFNGSYPAHTPHPHVCMSLFPWPCAGQRFPHAPAALFAHAVITVGPN